MTPRIVDKATKRKLIIGSALKVFALSMTLRLKILSAIMWLLMFIVPFVLPFPGLDNPGVFISLAGFGMLLLIGFNVWVLTQCFRSATE